MRNGNEVDQLLQRVRTEGLSHTLAAVFGTHIRVSLGYSTLACETRIEELELSVRSQNALNRASVFTIGGLIELINEDHLSKIRNLGRKSAAEIKTKLLAYGYAQLTDAEKYEFLDRTLTVNA